MEKILLWAYRTLSYYFPAAILLWTFVIENIISKDVSVASKIGATGIFLLIILIAVALVVVGKMFTAKEKSLEKESIKEIDPDKRAEIILKWEKVEYRHNLFNRIIMGCILAIFTVIVIMIEKKILALRGTLITMCISFFSGLGCYVGSNQIALNKKKNGSVKKDEEKV